MYYNIIINALVINFNLLSMFSLNLRLINGYRYNTKNTSISLTILS